MPTVVIETNRRVGGIEFGWPENALLDALDLASAEAPERRINANGEVELHKAGAIYRLQQNLFVEATFPDYGTSSYSAEIDGLAVLSVFDWLAGQPDHVDVARFRVSEQLGIAYDYRTPQTGSYTVFAPGHWAGLIV